MPALMLQLLRRRLESCGHDVSCYSYPSMRLTLDENGERLAAHCARMRAEKLHLVGHSMGGLVALAACRVLPAASVGRIVVAGTPYVDSFSARRLERLPGGRRMLGHCITQWLHGPRHDARQPHEVGVIAGSGGVGFGRIIAPDLPQPNDGVVCVRETAVPGMRDRIVLNVSHTAMLASGEVARQIHAFLDHGRFDRPGAGAA
jgi:pimeloyl-ACP methyl ester carboxylesterase